MTTPTTIKIWLITPSLPCRSYGTSSFIYKGTTAIKVPTIKPWITLRARSKPIFGIWRSPVVMMAKISNIMRICLYNLQIYFLVKYFMNRRPLTAPIAPPIGKKPIRRPTVEVSPAHVPKYFLRMVELMAEIMLRHNP